MNNGFLGTRGSFMLDLIVMALFIAIPLLFTSIWLARSHSNFRLHHTIQLALAGALLVALVAFEIELRVSGWHDRASNSRFWLDGSFNDWIDTSLAIHLLFAIPTPFLWAWVIYRAYQGFPSPPRPSSHSPAHRTWGWIAAVFLLMTAVTGWSFYWLAFVA